MNDQSILGISIQRQQRSQQLASIGTDTTLTVTGLQGRSVDENTHVTVWKRGRRALTGAWG
jgi:hypothetical protein